MVRLVSLTPDVVEALADPASFERLTGASLGNVARQARDAAAQDAAHRARTGCAPEWGGFLAVSEPGGQVVGIGGYVAAPDAAAAVEIAYGTFASYEGRGYATATAGALLARAAASGRVRSAYAHTLPEENASTHILTRHGFARVGIAHDADAGLVWRWERRSRESLSRAATQSSRVSGLPWEGGTLSGRSARCAAWRPADAGRTARHARRDAVWRRMLSA